MKILIVDDCVDLVGGVERTINTLSNTLVKLNEVEVLSENNLMETSFYEYDSKIKKKYLFDQINDKSRKYKKFSLRFIFYKTKEKFTRKFLKKKLIKNYLLNHKDVDVIIFGRVFVALDFLPVIKKLNIKSKIIVRDAIHLYFFNKSTKKKLLKYFPELVNTFIVSSDESINVYKDFLKNENINLIKLYNPIGINPVKKFSYESKEVVSIGRMDDNQKGFDNLIKSFALVHKNHPDWTLKLYGDGAIKVDLLNLIDDLNANEYIKILPSTKNVVKVFNNSSIFVLASRYEGYANILVEALSCGIPSISYDWLLGVDEIIKHDENGLIVNLNDRKKYFNGDSNQEDIIQLSNAINNLIENPSVCDKFSNASVGIIENRNIDIIISKWLEIIKGECDF